MSTPEIPSKSVAKRVLVPLGARSYEIRIGAGLISQLGPEIVRLIKGKRTLIVTDRQVGPRYGHPLAASLIAAGLEGSVLELPPGEGAKSLDVAKTLYDRCLETGLNRSSSIVALGGGVIGDLAGFVAATYMRGIDFIQVPTTLLAMVDASVGGKTAVDHSKAKNAIGAFHQPRAVYIDLDTLKSLPDREFKSGLAEVIKYGIIDDAEFFAYLEAHIEKILARNESVLSHIVARSCEIKARIVGEDERESEGGSRAFLNFGHTFAHAIETNCNYQGYLHGEAVAIGMLLAAELSQRQAGLSTDEVERIERLIERAGLPTRLKVGDPDAESLHAITFNDKKTRDGKLRFVLSRKIGSAYVDAEVSAQQALAIWSAAPRT